MPEDDSLRRAIEEPVRISPYDPSWPGQFTVEKNRLLDLFPGVFPAIEHIGSTAVPQLPAKPVIDLMAGVRSLAEADAVLPGLCENGYTTSAEFNATLIDRRWLMRHAEGHRTHHLHLVIFEGEEWRRRIKFRDILRTNPGISRQYQELKAKLAETVGSDREAYTEAKSEFIKETLKNTVARPTGAS